MSDQQKPINERFPNLDAYLAWLEQTQGPVDGPYYRQVSPGIYVLQGGNFAPLDGSAGSSQRFTRQELERKFGFTK